MMLLLLAPLPCYETPAQAIASQSSQPSIVMFASCRAFSIKCLPGHRSARLKCCNAAEQTIVTQFCNITRQQQSANLCSLGIVLARYWRALLYAALIQKSNELFVAAALHPLELLIGPRIHRHRPDKAQVHAQTPVLAAAFQAHEAAVRHRSPLRVLGLAVTADLQQWACESV